MDADRPSAPGAGSEAPAKAGALPPLDDGREHRLDPASITVKRLVGAIWTAALVLPAALSLSVALLLGQDYARWLLPALAAAAALLVAWIAWWPAASWRHAGWALDERGLTVRGGVVWRQVTLVPRNRVQHLDVVEGPLARAFGLATLVIHTAGTQHAIVPVRGLAREEAARLRDELGGSDGDDAV
jgi:hypothetical protein